MEKAIEEYMDDHVEPCWFQYSLEKPVDTPDASGKMNAEI
jgi:hypothetical protein